MRCLRMLWALSATCLPTSRQPGQPLKTSFSGSAQCSPDDVVVISFSCHGTRTNELATYDADPNDLPNTAIPLSLLATWFARIPARRLLCIIDSCFAGGIGAKVFIPDSSVPQNQPSANPFDQLSGDGRLVITSTAATEPAWEIGKFSHGLLTFYLLEALQGAEEVLAAGKISIYRLLEYITRRVIDRATQLGKPQHPTVRGHLEGELTWPVFRPGPTYQAAFPERSRSPVTADLWSLETYGFAQNSSTPGPARFRASTNFRLMQSMTSAFCEEITWLYRPRLPLAKRWSANLPPCWERWSGSGLFPFCP